MVWSPSTLSIVACDLETGEYGVAVNSRFFAVGGLVPHARALIGAVATQGWIEPSQGSQALKLLEEGAWAGDVLTGVLAADAGANVRQIGLVDREGRVAAWTGPDCDDWSGHLLGEAFCCQGCFQQGPQGVEAMAESFRSSSGPLPERLVAALEAGWQAGGDRWSSLSAALYVTRVNSGYGWAGDRYIDMRVDHHHEPVRELDRLLRAYRADLWGRLAEPVVVLDTDLIEFIQRSLRRQGHLTQGRPGQWDPATREALQSFCADGGLEVPRPLDGVALPQACFRGLLHRLIR